MSVMDAMCIAMGSWTLGLFTACFWVAWMDERSDTRAGIPWRKDLETVIDWSTRHPMYRH